MGLAFGSNIIEDGDKLRLAGSQPDKIYIGSNLSWENTIAPNAPTNFAASDTTVGKVTCTWTNSTVGVPVPTYDVYENDVRVGTNVTSGFVRSVGEGTRTYYVRAINSAGYANSNTDSGTSKKAAGSQTFTSNGTFVPGAGIKSVTICMCGGGGGGGNIYSDHGYYSGGGYAGTVYSNSSVAVTPGSSYTVTIGAGGAGGTDSTSNGSAGGTTKFGGISAAGGGGGSGNGTAYAGNGQSRSTCGGTRKNGAQYSPDGAHVAYGGQAGAYGDGGAGKFDVTGGTGGRGAGGGAGMFYNNYATDGGPGGAGYCVVSWS